MKSSMKINIQEIVWLNVTVNKALGVHELDACQHLVSQHQYCLDCESSTTKVEQIFQTLLENLRAN